MIAVPFIYFCILFYIYYHRAGRHIDIPCFIMIIYATSALFSIIMDIYGLRSQDSWNYKFSLLTTFTYCGLISLCLFPLAKVSHRKIRTIKPLKSDYYLRVIAWVAFLYFLFDLFMNIDSLIKVLTGDAAEIRNLVYTGEFESGWLSKIHIKLLRIPFIILNYSLGSFWIFIFLGFFCKYIQGLPNKYFLMYLAVSLKYVTGNLLLAGRSAIAYWILGFSLCLIFFLTFMQKKEIKKLIYYITPLSVFPFLYLSALTEGRFGNSGHGVLSGVQESLISYFGQSFINFCYFWDTFQSPVFYWQDVLPFIADILGESIKGGTAVNAALSEATGLNIGVFYTFIGNIQIATNKYIAILYCFVLYFLIKVFIRKRIIKEATIFDCYMIVLFSSVLVLGIFSSFYMASQMTFSAVLFAVILKRLSIDKSIKSL